MRKSLDILAYMRYIEYGNGRRVRGLAKESYHNRAEK